MATLTAAQRFRCERNKALALLRRDAKAWCRRQGGRAEPSSVCEPERVATLCDAPARADGAYVLLWVQQDARTECNQALEYACATGDALGVPVVAVYGLCRAFPGATERSLAFLVEGLVELRARLRLERGVRLVCFEAAPPDAVAALAGAAAVVVCDRGYTRPCRAWRAAVAALGARVVQVEANVVVPVELASSALEPSAGTLRPKLRRHLARFLRPMPVGLLVPAAPSIGADDADDGAWLAAAGVSLRDAPPRGDLDDAAGALARARGGGVDAVPACGAFPGGARAAVARLEAFGPVQATYATGKANDPTAAKTSLLSPYLHFGHISPLRVALAVASPTFREEVVVRREAARNFCYYAPDAYDTHRCAPDWALDALRDREDDARAGSYSRDALARGETDDDAWNAAQWQAVATGHMHNYMRM